MHDGQIHLRTFSGFYSLQVGMVDAAWIHAAKTSVRAAIARFVA